MKTKIEEKILKCKKCKTKTVHIRNVNRWTVGRTLSVFIMAWLTIGFSLLFVAKNKERWMCGRCM